jgi:Mrp family chromosome partitioning ATPase
MASCEGCPSKGNCSTEGKGGCSFEQLNQFSSIKNTIAVMSGKGGVGKSSVSVLIARELARRGLKVGILDADITGPSIPRLVGIPAGTRCTQGEMGVMPPKTVEGIPVISLNFFLENEEEPVIWRGPVLSSAVKQFWTDIFWGELDCLVIDMPPGTGDVVLTVMQSLPLSGAVVVSTPHDLASMVVAKSVKMAKKLNIKLIGLVENMAYIKCPDCGKEIRMFDEGPLRDLLDREQLALLGSLPMLPQIAALSKKDDPSQSNTALDADAAKILAGIGEKIAEQLH